MSVSYPKDFPLAETLELITIIRNGEVGAKKAQFGHNVWLIQGFAMRVTLGDPGTGLSETDAGVVLTPSAAPADFCAIEALEKVCANIQNGALTAQGAVPWKDILKWALQELVVVLATA
jgi:hypothetical protein